MRFYILRRPEDDPNGLFKNPEVDKLTGDHYSYGKFHPDRAAQAALELISNLFKTGWYEKYKLIQAEQVPTPYPEDEDDEEKCLSSKQTDEIIHLFELTEKKIEEITMGSAYVVKQEYKNLFISIIDRNIDISEGNYYLSYYVSALDVTIRFLKDALHLGRELKIDY